jgi:hypothetical protein
MKPDFLRRFAEFLPDIAISNPHPKTNVSMGLPNHDVRGLDGMPSAPPSSSQATEASSVAAEDREENTEYKLGAIVHNQGYLSAASGVAQSVAQPSHMPYTMAYGNYESVSNFPGLHGGGQMF